MNLFAQFSIGFRFSLAQWPARTESECWGTLLSRIPPACVAGGGLHVCMDTARHLPEDAMICAIGDLPLLQGRAICAHGLRDAVLQSYLTYDRPLLQDNEMLSLGRERYLPVGTVSADGTVINGPLASEGLRFCGEALPKRRRFDKVLLICDPYARKATEDFSRPLLRALGKVLPQYQFNRFPMPMQGVGAAESLVTAYHGRHALLTLPDRSEPVCYGVLPNRTVLLSNGLESERLMQMREMLSQAGYRETVFADTDGACQQMLQTALRVAALRHRLALIAVHEEQKDTLPVTTIHNVCKNAGDQTLFAIAYRDGSCGICCPQEREERFDTWEHAAETLASRAFDKA